MQVTTQRSPPKAIAKKTFARYEKALQEALAHNVLKDAIIAQLQADDNDGSGRPTKD